MVVIGQLLSFRFWYASVESDQCGVAIPELISISVVGLGACVASPRMASWEAIGGPHIRRRVGAAVVVILFVAVLMPLLDYVTVTSLPARLVPQSRLFSIDELTLEEWYPISTNIAIVRGIVLLGVALFGRLVGVVAAAILYVLLFWSSSSSTTTMTPYSAFCTTKTESPAWVPATVLAGAAIAVWFRTGGNTVRSRRLDPRDES